MKFIHYILLAFLLTVLPAQALTVKDMVSIKGVQSNEVSGYSIVTGLQGTGDKKNPVRDKMINAIINNYGLELPSGALDSKNTAFVQVSGIMSAYAGVGQELELTVSTIGNAKSLKNGILRFTKLGYPGDTNFNRFTYATASGPLQMLEGQTETSGKVKGLVQKEVPSTIVRGGYIHLQLKTPDTVDADRVARSINQSFQRAINRDIAKAEHAGLILVEVPESFYNKTNSFVAQMEVIPVLGKRGPAKILINEKTNIVSFNERVEVSPFSFSYKDMSITVEENKTSRTESIHRFAPLAEQRQTDLGQLIRMLNDIGVKAEDLIHIVKHIHKLGVLHGELVIE